jgi:hypothetical protein
VLLRRTDTRCEEKREMPRIPPITFQSHDAPALGAFNHRLLRDCGLNRYGETVVAAVDDPRIVHLRKPGLLRRLSNLARLMTMHTDAGKVVSGDLIEPRAA